MFLLCGLYVWCSKGVQKYSSWTLTLPASQKSLFSFFFPLKLDMYFPGSYGLRSSFDQQDVVETVRTSPNEPYILRGLLCVLHKHAFGLGWMLHCWRCAGKQCARASPNEPHIYYYHDWSVLRASQTNMRLGIVGSVGGALELGVGVDAIYYMCKLLARWRWH